MSFYTGFIPFTLHKICTSTHPSGIAIYGRAAALVSKRSIINSSQLSVAMHAVIKVLQKSAIDSGRRKARQALLCIFISAKKLTKQWHSLDHLDSQKLLITLGQYLRVFGMRTINSIRPKYTNNSLLCNYYYRVQKVKVLWVGLCCVQGQIEIAGSLVSTVMLQ